MKNMPAHSAPNAYPSSGSTRREFLMRATVAAVGAAVTPEMAALGQNEQERPVPSAIQTSAINRIQVSNRVQHTMAGGMGASWHAIGPTAYFYGEASRNIKGSAWGGTPPANYSQQWDDLQKNFRWLGLDFVRVELEMHMYESERDRFDWQNSEMKMLYRILDVCQENHADVFLTQMWQDVDWNTIDGVHPVSSAPKSVPDFATGLEPVR